jgi:ABC-type nitrate/sulfonate/bicarbonate transport system substrate-binding protein
MYAALAAFAGHRGRNCIVVAALAGLLASGAAQAQTKIMAGMVAHGPPQWPQYIAEELGWFKQDNIDLRLVTVGGGGVAQVAAGSLDMAHSGYPDFARAALHDAPVRIVLSDFIGSPYGVFAKKNINTIAALKGKLIASAGRTTLR